MPTGVLARGEPQPTGKLASPWEGTDMPHGPDQGRRGQEPDAGDLAQAPYDWIGVGEGRRSRSSAAMRASMARTSSRTLASTCRKCSGSSASSRIAGTACRAARGPADQGVKECAGAAGAARGRAECAAGWRRRPPAPQASLPATPPAVRFRHVTADSQLGQRHQGLVAVISLIADHLGEALCPRRVRPSSGPRASSTW